MIVHTRPTMGCICETSRGAQLCAEFHRESKYLRYCRKIFPDSVRCQNPSPRFTWIQCDSCRAFRAGDFRHIETSRGKLKTIRENVKSVEVEEHHQSSTPRTGLSKLAHEERMSKGGASDKTRPDIEYDLRKESRN